MRATTVRLTIVLSATLAVVSTFAVMERRALAKGGVVREEWANVAPGGAVFPNESPVGDPESKPKTRNAARGQAVCVRLCDGFFFPGPAAAENACESACPDAPTAIYYEPAGSDRIEDATSASGQRYTSLPVALRYRTALDSTCTCRRAASHYQALRDPTLRKGDAVMTASGAFIVYQGQEGRSASANFRALSSADLPALQRGELGSMERAATRVVVYPPRTATGVAAD